MMQSDLTKQLLANRAGIHGQITADMVSEVSRIEGGTTKGSLAAKMQHKMTKQILKKRRANRYVVDVGLRRDDTPFITEPVTQVAERNGGILRGSETSEVQSPLYSQPFGLNKAR